jgi:hypothetical protein
MVKDAKGPGTRPVGFRMPADLWADYAAVAGVKGLDVSAVMIDALTEQRPRLLAWKAEHERAMRATLAPHPALEDVLQVLAAIDRDSSSGNASAEMFFLRTWHEMISAGKADAVADSLRKIARALDVAIRQTRELPPPAQGDGDEVTAA